MNLKVTQGIGNNILQHGEIDRRYEIQRKSRPLLIKNLLKYLV
jgi:hypothetical protein